MNILVLNGPNLNLLGSREPEIYGNQSYEDLLDYLRSLEKVYHIDFTIKQSNHEGDLIDLLHKANTHYQGVLLNAGAFTHYSYALYDAIKGINVPVIEVHLTDINSRPEEWRKKSVIKTACKGQISGLGFQSYEEGLKLLLKEGTKK